ncbi:TetR/AcrR family transcriptional regulator [Streptomyces sp. YIM S03343]
MESAHHANRGGSDRAREELLDAAQRAFAERGFEATALRDITDTVGVAHGMVRHHFGSKTGLWRAAVDRAVDRYRSTLAPHAVLAPQDPAEVRAATRAAVRAFLDANAHHPALLRLMLNESVRGGERLDYVLRQFEPVAALMAPLFQQAQRAGYLRGFTQPSFLLFLLTAGAMPFALPALSAGLLGAPLDPGSPRATEHIERILSILYGPDGGSE